MGEANIPPSTGPTPALVRAVRQMLRPLVGLLIDHGLTYNWLSKLLKVIFVDVAEDEFKLDNKEQTDSRISLLTGVNRKEVRRIRGENKEAFEPPSSIFIGAQLVAIWTTEERFTEKNGAPAALPRLSSTERRSDLGSFEELVELVSKDIRPRAILDEWLRLGAVSLNHNDMVCLEIDAFIPNQGFDEKAFYLGRNVHDHMAAARANVQNEVPPFTERGVYYDYLSQQSVAKLNKLSKKRGMELLKEINGEARKLQMADKKSKTAKERMNFGIYFYTEPHD